MGFFGSMIGTAIGSAHGARVADRRARARERAREDGRRRERNARVREESDAQLRSVLAAEAHRRQAQALTALGSELAQLATNSAEADRQAYAAAERGDMPASDWWWRGKCELDRRGRLLVERAERIRRGTARPGRHV